MASRGPVRRPRHADLRHAHGDADRHGRPPRDTTATSRMTPTLTPTRPYAAATAPLRQRHIRYGTLLSQGIPSWPRRRELDAAGQHCVDGNLTTTRWSRPSAIHSRSTSTSGPRTRQPGGAHLAELLRQGIRDPDVEPTPPPGRRSSPPRPATGVRRPHGQRQRPLRADVRDVRATGYGCSLTTAGVRTVGGRRRKPRHCEPVHRR